MSKLAIISNTEPEICTALKKLGFKLIYTECVDGFISYEQKHADMQCLAVDKKIFVLSQCTKLADTLKSHGIDVTATQKTAQGKYPSNIPLNVKIVGKNVIGKADSIDIVVVDFLEDKGYNFINVNQGYAACSCAKVTDNAIITADNSIIKALEDTEIEVLKINEGFIKLADAGDSTYGFIGGASVLLDSENLLFFGEIETHPDYKIIKAFCNDRKVNIHSISNIPLTDVGSAILLNY